MSDILNLATREEMIQEAIKRMRMLELFPKVIKEFRTEGLINISHAPFASLYWIEDEESLKRIKKIEEEYGCVIYHVVRSYFRIDDDILKMDSFLFVTKYRSDWKYDRADYKDNNSVMSYTYNWTDPICSEYGSIGVKPQNGGLLRIW